MSERDDVRNFYAKYSPENHNFEFKEEIEIDEKVEESVQNLCKTYGIKEDSPHIFRGNGYACVVMGKEVNEDCKQCHSTKSHLPLNLCGKCWPMDHALKAWRSCKINNKESAE
jgi:hypothetical protein